MQLGHAVHTMMMSTCSDSRLSCSTSCNAVVYSTPSRHEVELTPGTAQNAPQAHLRAQLLSKLCALPTAPPPSQPKSLAYLTTDLLVADYLHQRHYHYTLSVFQPEAGVAGGHWPAAIPTIPSTSTRCTSPNMARCGHCLWHSLHFTRRCSAPAICAPVRTAPASCCTPRNQCKHANRCK